MLHSQLTYNILHMVVFLWSLYNFKATLTRPTKKQKLAKKIKNKLQTFKKSLIFFTPKKKKI